MRWINVKRRLPDHGDVVLTKTIKPVYDDKTYKKEHVGLEMAYYDFDRNLWNLSNCCDYGVIAPDYWISLDRLYEEIGMDLVDAMKLDTEE
jgi:hypothetical protein